MGVYSPTINIYSTGVVSVISTDDTKYNTIVNSQSGYSYKINKTYINTSSLEQLFQPYQYNHYDVNGNIKAFTQNVLIDPYQVITASYYEPLEDNVVLDGRTGLGFSILPNEVIQMVIFTTQIANKDFVTPTHFFQDEFFNVLDDYNKEL
jgi:hypothetical protein